MTGQNFTCPNKVTCSTTILFEGERAGKVGRRWKLLYTNFIKKFTSQIRVYILLSSYPFIFPSLPPPSLFVEQY
jgi:hypothetical protein